MTTTSPSELAAPGDRPRSRAGRVLMAAGGGLLLGVLTNLAQGWLPGAWNQIANSGAAWSAVAFAAGALLYRSDRVVQAAIRGQAAEAGLVVGYYGYAEIGRDGVGNLLFPLIWLGLACVAGPLFGVAGQWWRGGHDERPRPVRPGPAVPGPLDKGARLDAGSRRSLRAARLRTHRAASAGGL